MKHLIFWIIIGILSFVTYQNSDVYVEKEFVVIEKNKEDLQLVYLENNTHKTYTATEKQYINSEINETFKIESYTTTFYVLFILTVLMVVIYILVFVSGDVVYLGDIFEIFT